MINIQWLGHASFKIKIDYTIIYIDPFAGDYDEKADFILVTQNHYAHSNLEKISKARVDETIVLTTRDNSGHINGQGLFPGDTKEFKDIKIQAMPAYNLRKEFYTEDHECLGFLITIGDKSIYHTGDTDMIPEMAGLKPDVALLPVGGTYTMNAREAAIAAESIKPKLVIPMHFGAGIVGTIDDAELFKELVEVYPEIKVKILKEGETIEI